MLQTDSKEYEILEEAAEMIKGVPGLTCEIGIRMGGGSEKIMRRLHATGQKDRVHIGIDPYGNIEYATSEDVVCRHGYSNEMFYGAMAGLYRVAEELSQHFLFFPLEDSVFFERFGRGVPVYREFKYEENAYALVHFDGPHALLPVRDEFIFFSMRCHRGAVFVFDDIGNYPHEQLEDQYLLPQQWRLLRKGTTKASYIKE